MPVERGSSWQGIGDAVPRAAGPGDLAPWMEGLAACVQPAHAGITHTEPFCITQLPSFPYAFQPDEWHWLSTDAAASVCLMSLDFFAPPLNVNIFMPAEIKYS